MRFFLCTSRALPRPDVNFISHVGIAKNTPTQGSAARAKNSSTEQERCRWALEELHPELNQLALNGKIDPLIGRDLSWNA